MGDGGPAVTEGRRKPTEWHQGRCHPRRARNSALVSRLCARLIRGNVRMTPLISIHRRRLASLFVAGFVLATGPLSAGDWPHWLGPKSDNNAIADGFDADLSHWKTGWKAALGKGYSSIAVADGRAFCLGHDGTAGETVYCFDAATGETKWKVSYPAELMPRMHTGGPNATPTVVGDKVITVSKDGQVLCLTTAKGDKVWQASLPEAMGINVPQWGFGASAVVDGKQVLLAAGKVVSLDLADGHKLWASKEAYHPGYATVGVLSQAGKKFLAALDGKGFSVLSATDGAELARIPFKSGFDLNATSPTVLADGKRILVVGNSAAVLLSFDGLALAEVWANKDLKNAMNNSVVAGDTIYGIDGRQGSGARLVAVDLADGKVLWSKDGFGYGNTIGVGSAILALTESGELVTVQASRDGYKELGRRQVLSKTCWTTPVVAAGHIYARNDKGDLIALAH